jgi:hypothetical protein
MMDDDDDPRSVPFHSNRTGAGPGSHWLWLVLVPG